MNRRFDTRSSVPTKAMMVLAALLGVALVWWLAPRGRVPRIDTQSTYAPQRIPSQPSPAQVGPSTVLAGDEAPLSTTAKAPPRSSAKPAAGAARKATSVTQSTNSAPLWLLVVVTAACVTATASNIFVLVIAGRAWKHFGVLQKIDRHEQRLSELSERMQQGMGRMPSAEHKAVDPQTTDTFAVRSDELDVGDRGDESRCNAVPAASRRHASTTPKPKGPKPETSEWFDVVARAADTVIRSGSRDAESLTANVRAMMDAEGASLGSYRLCAHSGMDLKADFADPDFLSVTLSYKGHLLPRPKRDYQNIFSRYYEGHNVYHRWPKFSEAAQCSLDASNQASVHKKGRL